MTRSPARNGLCALLLAICAASLVSAATHVYEFTFDQPMSWADDISPWGMTEIQYWDIADGGDPGKALKISAAEYQQPRSCEGRTLQFNHKPGTSARVSFDIKAVSTPPESFSLVRYYDGYCGAMPFVTIADDEIEPFPEPIWDSREAKLSNGWQHVEFTTPKLQNTVLTLFLMAQQPKEIEGRYIEYLIDNLKVETTLLGELMDPHFQWHGNHGGSTSEFWKNTGGANIDWCDYADQEDVQTDKGIIHYTLLQFRDTSSNPVPAWKHQVSHESYNMDTGCKGAVVTVRSITGDMSAASWGVRQTVSYEAFGLKPEDTARLQVKLKCTNHDYMRYQISSAQLGVDPLGGVITQNAKWTAPNYTNYCVQSEWHKADLEFEKPRGATAFTIYFRHRDGVAEPPVMEAPHEPQSRAGHKGSRAIADWVFVKVLSE